jgi:hypothetical protein
MTVVKEALFRDARKNRVVILEDLNFFWDRPELTKIKHMWNKGVSVKDIAEHFERDPDEILLALIHMARDEKIVSRKEGLG